MPNPTPAAASPAQKLVDLDRVVTAALPKGVAARIGVLGLPCSELEGFKTLDPRNWFFASKARDARFARLTAWAELVGAEDPIDYENEVLFPEAKNDPSYEAYALRQRLSLVLRPSESHQTFRQLLAARDAVAEKLAAKAGSRVVDGEVMDKYRLEDELTASIEGLAGALQIGQLVEDWGPRLVAALPRKEDADRLGMRKLQRLRRVLSTPIRLGTKPSEALRDLEGTFPAHLGRLDSTSRETSARLERVLKDATGNLLQRIERRHRLSGAEARQIIAEARLASTASGLSELTGIPCPPGPLEEQILQFKKTSQALADMTRLGFVSRAIRYRSAELRSYAARFPDETVEADSGTSEWTIAIDDEITTRAEGLERSTVPFSRALDAQLLRTNTVSR